MCEICRAIDPLLAGDYAESAYWSDGVRFTSVGFAKATNEEFAMLEALIDEHEDIVAEAGEKAGITQWTGVGSPSFIIQPHGVFGVSGEGQDSDGNNFKFELETTDDNNWVCVFRPYDPSDW